MLRLLEQTRDRVLASDPAFSRLRAAVRAILSLVITGCCLGAFHKFIHHLPIAGFGLAVLISLIGSMLIRDPSPRDQLVSRACAGAGAIASVLIAAALSRWKAAADVAFLLVIFAAVYVRRFGPRWLGVSVIAFMGYFMGDYFHPHVADIGWVAVAAITALTVSQLVATVLLKEDPEKDFRRALVTLDRRVDVILRDLRDRPEDAHGAVKDRKRPREDLAQLRAAVLIAEDFIPKDDDGSLAAEGPASELALALFEWQLSVERLVGASFTKRPAGYRVDQALHGDRRADDSAPDDDPASQLLTRVQQARSHLQNVLGPAPSPAFARAPEIAAAAPNPVGSPPGDDRGPAKAFETPIQVTVACGLALGCGLLVSSARWYWAVLSAFIVFNNTRSRADTARRALQRSAGTVGGLLVGTAVATLLAGQTIVSAAGILLLLLVGFYFVQTAYSVMMFCLTVALALLYGLMGKFTPHLLVLRLEETVVGALSGTGVAFFLFPNRAETVVDASLGTFVKALEALVEAARQRACGSGVGNHLLALSRDLDRAYSDLAKAVRPMGGAWTAVTQVGPVGEKLLLFTGCVHWGRSLARGLAGDRPPEPGACERVSSLAKQIEGRAAEACRRGSSLFERGRGDREDMGDERSPVPIRQAEDPIFSLEVISVLMARAVA